MLTKCKCSKSEPESSARDKEHRWRWVKATSQHLWIAATIVNTPSIYEEEKPAMALFIRSQKKGLLLHPRHPTVHWTRGRTQWNLVTPSVRTNKCIKITGLVTASHRGGEWQLCVKWVEQSYWGLFDTTWMKISFHDGASIPRVASLIICSLGSFR